MHPEGHQKEGSNAATTTTTLTTDLIWLLIRWATLYTFPLSIRLYTAAAAFFLRLQKGPMKSSV